MLCSAKCPSVSFLPLEGVRDEVNLCPGASGSVRHRRATQRGSFSHRSESAFAFELCAVRESHVFVIRLMCFVKHMVTFRQRCHTVFIRVNEKGICLQELTVIAFIIKTTLSRSRLQISQSFSTSQQPRLTVDCPRAAVTEATEYLHHNMSNPFIALKCKGNRINLHIDL